MNLLPSRHIRQKLTWLLVGLALAYPPSTCFARGGHGGGGHGGGGHFGGGGGHFGGGGGHFGGGGGHFGGGGGHFGGGHMGGGHMGGGNFGGHQMQGGNFGGGQIRGGNFGGGHIGGGQNGGFTPSRSVHQPNFGGSQGMHAPQIRSNPASPGMHIRGQSPGSSNVHNGSLGGQGTLHHGVNLQSGRQLQGTNGYHWGGAQGTGQGRSIQPNHSIYGHGSHLGQSAGGIANQHGIGNRTQNVLNANQGIGGRTLHNAGRANLPGNGGTHNGLIGSGLGGHHHQIGSPTQLASRQNGAGQLVSAGGAGGMRHHNGQNNAQFHGRHANGNNNGAAWGLNRNGNLHNGNWNVNYRNTVINNNYYGWYNSPWGGLWGFGWGYPYYRSAFGWGLGGYFSPWWGYGGYGNYGYGSYYNPYCVYAPQIVYVNPLGANFYAQPLALPLANADASTSATDPKREAAFQTVEQGRALFLQGDYRGALDKYDAAIPDLSDDPVVHELRALALFALGDYHESAATLNALLAVAPGMDWQSMRNQYPDVATYTKHLRALESFRDESPNDAAARFVLGYHYLVTNFTDAAAKQFAKVVELEPRDAVAKKLLDTLTKDQKPATPDPLPAGVDANTPLQTDLVGKWLSKGEDGSQFALNLDEDGKFTWLVTPPKGNPVKQTGEYTSTPDRLILDSSGQQETLMARVESRGPNHFRFWITDDVSLAFHRDGINAPEPVIAAKVQDGAATLPEAPIPIPPIPSAISPANAP